MGEGVGGVGVCFWQRRQALSIGSLTFAMTYPLPFRAPNLEPLPPNTNRKQV